MLTTNWAGKTRIGLAILMACFLAGSHGVLAAQGPAIVRPEVEALDLAIGEESNLAILLENARDVYAIDVQLTFDPALVEVVDANPSRPSTQIIPGVFPAPDFVAINTADNAAGTIRYVITQLNPTPPANGQGVLFSLQLRGLASGETQLQVTTVEMADTNGMLLDVDTSGALIRVGTGSTIATDAAPTGVPLGTLPAAGSGGTAGNTTITSTPLPPPSPTMGVATVTPIPTFTVLATLPPEIATLSAEMSAGNPLSTENSSDEPTGTQPESDSTPASAGTPLVDDAAASPVTQSPAASPPPPEPEEAGDVQTTRSPEVAVIGANQVPAGDTNPSGRDDTTATQSTSAGPTAIISLVGLIAVVAIIMLYWSRRSRKT